MNLIPDVKSLPSKFSVQAMATIGVIEGIYQVDAVQALVPPEYKAVATGLLVLLGLIGRAISQQK